VKDKSEVIVRHRLVIPYSGKPYWRGRLSAVDLLALASLDQLIFIMKIEITFFIKRTNLMRRSTVLILPPQLVFPAYFKQMMTKFRGAG
jgi:hypothetical protein